MAQTAVDSTMVADARIESPPAERSAAPAPRLTISTRFLLGIYAIVPLCLLAMLLDRLLWSESLFRSLPTSPESFFIFQLVFGTPHIIASSVILATNVGYLRTYWLRLLLFSLFLLLFFGVGSLFIPYNGFLAVVGAATVLHVIKQQVGVGKGICRLSSWVYEVWGWTLIAFGSILYYAIYTSQEFSPLATAWIHGVLWTLAALVFVLTVACHARITTVKGRLYLWANAVMVLQSGLFYADGYFFLAILAPRLVHDLTAFAFYVAHDVNRHGDQPQNLLYRAASKLGLGIFWVCPVVAALLTYLIGTYVDPVAESVLPLVLGFDLRYSVSFVIVGYLGMLHYFTEVFTWKQGSPYRRHVAMS